MAIIKSVETATGAVINYWHISGVSKAFPSDEYNVELNGFISESARRNDKPPMTTINISIVGDATLDRAELYKAIAQYSNFGGASDEPETQIETEDEMKKVLIEQNDEGTFSVGEELPEEQSMSTAPGEEQSMQPAETLDEALDIARQLLSEENPQDAEMAKEDMMRGYNSKSSAQKQMSPETLFGE